MARIYTPKESEKWIPHNLYMSIIYQIRDYDRQKAELDAFRESADRGHNPTERKGIKIVQMGRTVSAIEHALEDIPKEYRPDVWAHIVNGAPYPDYANIKTWRKYKLLFIRLVGENLGYLDKDERLGSGGKNNVLL